MDDETHLVDYASMLVPSLKQCSLMKIAETLIRPDLEDFCFFDESVSHNPFKRISANIEQHVVLRNFQKDISRTILCLYRHLRNMTPDIHDSGIKMITPSTVKFNARGDVDLRRTLDDYMEDMLRWPRTPRTYLHNFLHDACHFRHEQCVHMMLCKLAKWDRSELEPLIRNARPEVEITLEMIGDMQICYYSIRFVIEDLVDLVPWTSFVTILNNNNQNFCTQFSFSGNILEVSIEDEFNSEEVALLWPKMTTIVKFEHAAEIFEMALKQSDACLLVQTMHYLDSTERMHLVKANLVPFILCFLTHPYYREFLPDLELVSEDRELLNEEDIREDLERLLSPLEMIGDYTNFSDCLVQLWNYCSSRDKLLGEHMFSNIKAFLNSHQDVLAIPRGVSSSSIPSWLFRPAEDDSEQAFTRLRNTFGLL